MLDEQALKLRRDIRVLKRENGERTDYVISDPVSGRYFLLRPLEFQIAGMLDGSRTIAGITAFLEKSGQDVSAHDVAGFVARLRTLGLIENTPPELLYELEKNSAAAKKKAVFDRFFFFYLPLFNPDDLLRAIAAWSGWFFSKWLAALISLLSLVGVFTVVAAWERVGATRIDFLDPRHVLYFWIALFCVKLVHEFGHSIVARKHGVGVTQFGVAFLIFFPCLFCNVSDAWMLRDKKSRIAISSAGIFAEIAVAAGATFVWFFTRDGVLNSIAFYMMSVSWVTSLLFNGNPLMKFDGYYVLSDFLEIPNLQKRSFDYLKYLADRYLLAVPAPAPGLYFSHKLLFVLYGASACGYRFFLYLGICATVYYKFNRYVGAVLGAVAIALYVGRPLVAAARHVILLKGPAAIRILRLALVGLTIWAGYAQAVVLRERALDIPCIAVSSRSAALVTAVGGVVTDLRIRQGDVVKRGQPLIALDMRPKEDELKLLLIEEAILLERRKRAVIDQQQMTEVKNIELELATLRDRAATVRAELAEATLRAELDGSMLEFDEKIFPGLRIERGRIVGILGDTAATAFEGIVSEYELKHLRKLIGGPISIHVPALEYDTVGGTLAEVSHFREDERVIHPALLRSAFRERAADRKYSQTPEIREAFYRVAVKLDRPARHIRPGSTGTIVLPLEKMSLAQMAWRRILRIFQRETLL